MTKKTIINIISITLLAALICACATTKPVNTDWAGEYTGTIPAADCPGINVKLTVNADFTYELFYSYIDREHYLKYTGTFRLNEAGDTIIIAKADQFYRIGENYLQQLDTDGKEIKSEFADMYILRRKTNNE